jgi:hypothetical protein
MEPTPIDRYFAAKCVKSEVDKVYKEAETEAAIYLDEARDEGKTSLISMYFGEEAGEYKRGKTRAKHVTEFNVCDTGDLESWAKDNAHTMMLLFVNHTKELVEWLINETGEIPDGIARVEYDLQPTLKAPSIYRYDHELVKAKLAEGGNILQGANRLLLGDGND